MTNGNLPATTGNVPATTGELEMNDWLRKLKENQNQKKDEKLRRYNDIISKFIIILVVVCVVCFIAIAALAVENNDLYKKNEQLSSLYTQNETALNSQITKLTVDNDNYRNFILSNRTFNNVEYTVNVDPSLPKINMITFNNNKVHFDFADGTSQDKYFIDYNLYVSK